MIKIDSVKKCMVVFLVVFVAVFTRSTAYSQNETIAVLTFENLTQNPEKNWVGIGFAETLTTKLSKIKSLQLIERIQMEKLLKEIGLGMSGIVDEKTAQKAGKILGAKYLVIGSYQEMNNEYVVNARVVKVETAEVSISEEVKGKDIFDLESELAIKVAKDLGMPLTPEEETAIMAKPAQNTVAHEYFSRGVEFFYNGDNKKAIEQFKKALVADPNYTDAKLWLGTAAAIAKVMKKVPNWRIGLEYHTGRAIGTFECPPTVGTCLQIGKGSFEYLTIYYSKDLNKNFTILAGISPKPSIKYGYVKIDKPILVMSLEYYLNKKMRMSPFIRLGMDYLQFTPMYGANISQTSKIALSMGLGMKLLSQDNFSLILGAKFVNIGEMDATYFGIKEKISFKNQMYFSGMQFQF